MIREFKPRWLWPRQIKPHLKVKMRNDHDYCFLLAFYIDDKLRWNWTDRSAVRLNIDREWKIYLRVRLVIQALNLKISRCRLADYVKEFYLCACRTCSTIIFPHLSNQRVIFCLCCCRRRCCRRSSNSLIYSLVAVVIMMMTIYNDNGDVFAYLNLKYLGKLKIELC